MPDRSSKDKIDISSGVMKKLAFIESFEGKNPAAVMLGRLGGLKGGKARAEKLSRKRRVEIAKTAAMVRWGNKK